MSRLDPEFIHQRMRGHFSAPMGYPLLLVTCLVGRILAGPLPSLPSDHIRFINALFNSPYIRPIMYVSPRRPADHFHVVSDRRFMPFDVTITHSAQCTFYSNTQSTFTQLIWPAHRPLRQSVDARSSCKYVS